MNGWKKCLMVEKKEITTRIHRQNLLEILIWVLFGKKFITSGFGPKVYTKLQLCFKGHFPNSIYRSCSHTNTHRFPVDGLGPKVDAQKLTSIFIFGVEIIFRLCSTFRFGVIMFTSTHIHTDAQTNFWLTDLFQKFTQTYKYGVKAIYQISTRFIVAFFELTCSHTNAQTDNQM